MPDSYTTERHAEDLRKRGSFEMANLPLAKEYMAALKPQFPDLDYVHGVGAYDVGQIVFLPKAKRGITAQVRYQLKHAEQAVRAKSKALAKLTR